MLCSRRLGHDRKVFRLASWIFLPADLALLAYACHAANTIPLTPLEFVGEAGGPGRRQIPMIARLRVFVQPKRA